MANSNDKICDAIDAALKQWKQGDCVVGEQWFVYRILIDSPLTNDAVDAAENDVDLAETEVLGMVVLSQTCDIVRPCRERPFIEVAPLVEVDEINLRVIERGHRPRYAFVPGLRKKTLVADLDRVMSIEKAVMVRWNRVSGCNIDKEQRDFSLALARKRARFAFPDDFTAFVSALHKRMQDKHDKKSNEGLALRSLLGIRVHAAPDWEADPVHIHFWFIRHEDAEDFNGKSWHELLDGWLKLVPANQRFDPVNGTVVTLEDMSAQDYVESDPLDLDHLSTRSA